MVLMIVVYNLLIDWVYWGYNPPTSLLITSWDICFCLSSSSMQDLVPDIITYCSLISPLEATTGHPGNTGRFDKQRLLQ